MSRRKRAQKKSSSKSTLIEWNGQETSAINAGLSIREFWHECTPFQAYKVVRAHKERMLYDYKINLNEWRLLRWLGSKIHNTAFGIKKSQMKQPHQLFKLPGDIESNPVMDEKQFHKLKRKADKAVR